MAKIRSTKQLVYNSRGSKSAIIEIEINSWNFTNNGYVAIVNDYAISQIDVQIMNLDQTVSTIQQEQKLLIETKSKPYSKTQIDGLFALLQNPILITESYSDEMDLLISAALLYVTQNEPVYNSVASDWEIVT